MDDGANTTYQAPKLVASQLGVSASGLRRLAAIYESVHGPLPKDTMGGRMWTTTAVARLEGAKALVDAGRVKSVREALERPAGQLSAEVAELPPQLDAQGALMLVLAELQDLRTEVADLKQRQLEAPKDDARERELAAQVADLEQRNAALFGELERRRLEAERPQRRGWWGRLFGQE